MSEWQQVERLKTRIMALPGEKQGPLFAELCVLSDKLFGIGILLENLENTVNDLEQQKIAEQTIFECVECGSKYQDYGEVYPMHCPACAPSPGPEPSPKNILANDAILRAFATD